MRRSLVLPLVTLLPLFIIFVACDSGGSNQAIDNEFSLTIQPTSSGSASIEASQKQIDGFSFFYDAENPNTGEEAFGIYMTDAESFSKQEATDGLFGFLARNADRPGTGTYSFTDPESGGGSTNFLGLLYEDFDNAQAEPYYVLESGTLTLKTSSGDKVAGEITATGTEYVFSGGTVNTRSVEITGEFTAKDVETFVPFTTSGI